MLRFLLFLEAWPIEMHGHKANPAGKQLYAVKSRMCIVDKITQRKRNREESCDAVKDT